MLIKYDSFIKIIIFLFILNICFLGSGIGMPIGTIANRFVISSIIQIVLSLILIILLLIESSGNKLNFISIPLLYQFAALTILTFLSITTHPTVSLQGWSLLLMFIQGTMTYFIVYTYITNVDRLRYIINIIFLMFALEGALGVYQFLNQKIAPNVIIVHMGKEFFIRSAGTIGHPGPYGVFLALILPMVISVTLHSNENKTIKVLSQLCTLLLGTLGIIASLTRSAWAGLVISVMIIFAFVGQKRIIDKSIWKYLILLICILLIVLNLIFPPGAIMNRLFKSDTLRQLNLRLDLDKITFRIIKDYPLWGIGVGNYAHTVTKYTPIYQQYLPHKQYLYWTVEYGIFGLIIFVWFIISVLKLSWRALKKRNDLLTFSVSLGFFSSFCSLLVINLSGLAMSHISIFLLFCLLLGVNLSIFRYC